MKFFAVILALMVFISSAAPQMAEQAMADIHPTCENSADGDGCCDICCSPFHSCGSCHGFTVAAMDAVATDLQGKLVHLIDYTHPFYSAFCGDIWQPPKIMNN